jgi:YesN/AraC family two-component response regulator
MKELGIHSEDVIHPELQEQLRTASHMSRFEEWFIQSASGFFQLQEQKMESHKYEMVGKARQYIEQHLQEPLSLELVAEHVHLTPRYLSKLFKEESGSTFTEYVTHIRLNRAKELIETTSYSVEQISSLAGFSSSAYFIRKFKEAFGSTPKVYKSRLE